MRVLEAVLRHSAIAVLGWQCTVRNGTVLTKKHSPCEIISLLRHARTRIPPRRPLAAGSRHDLAVVHRADGASPAPMDATA